MLVSPNENLKRVLDEKQNKKYLSRFNKMIKRTLSDIFVFFLFLIHYQLIICD